MSKRVSYYKVPIILIEVRCFHLVFTCEAVTRHTARWTWTLRSRGYYIVMRSTDSIVDLFIVIFFLLFLASLAYNNVYTRAQNTRHRHTLSRFMQIQYYSRHSFNYTVIWQRFKRNSPRSPSCANKRPRGYVRTRLNRRQVRTGGVGGKKKKKKESFSLGFNFFFILFFLLIDVALLIRRI